MGKCGIKRTERGGVKDGGGGFGREIGVSRRGWQKGGIANKGGWWRLGWGQSSFVHFAYIVVSGEENCIIFSFPFGLGMGNSI